MFMTRAIILQLLFSLPIAVTQLSFVVVMDTVRKTELYNFSMKNFGFFFKNISKCSWNLDTKRVLIFRWQYHKILTG